MKIANTRRLRLLLQKIASGEALTAAEIKELTKYNDMAKKRKGKGVSSAVALAEKRRHAHLLSKVKKNQKLSAKEIKDLKLYESKLVSPKDVFVDLAAAAKFTGKSKRTILRWAKEGNIRLDGGGYSKKLIKEFLKNRKKTAAGNKLKRNAVKPGPSLAESVDGWGDLSDRDRQAKRMAEKRRAARDVKVPPVKNPRRRAKGKKDWKFFCLAYYPDLFYLPFSKNQIEIGDDIVRSIKTGVNRAKAAERGGGKTTIVKVLAGVYAPVYGFSKYLPIIRANATDAERTLKDIKAFYEHNDLLCEDFPEVCVPIRALEGAAQRAGAQTVGGERTRLEWGGKEVVLPRVKDKNGKLSDASGAVITSVGIDGPIRGLVRGPLRPDLVIIDDLETRESVRSHTESQKRKETIDCDISGLAGPDKIMPILMIGTIIKRGCLIDQYTDPKISPAWHGTRHKRLLKEPKNVEMWQRYMEMRQQNERDGDETGRGAHKYYLDNRKQMDKGAKVSNEYRFKTLVLDDGSQLEASAIESVYNDICKFGMEGFNTEFQNDPGEDSSEGDGIEAVHVQRKLSGMARGLIPAGTLKVTMAIDVHRRWLYWAVVAWKAGAIGNVIDYGYETVQSPLGNLVDQAVQKAMDEAILSAMLEFKDSLENTGGFVDEVTNKMRLPDLCLVDSGWRPDAVQAFCRAGGGRYMASSGFGANQLVGKYKKPGKIKLPFGDHWHMAIRPGMRQRYIALDVDYCKRRVHDGFMIPDTQNGSLAVFGDDPLRHRNFADQILGEVWVSEFSAGKGVREGWVVRHGRNHWLDGMAQNVAAAEMLNITVLKKVQSRPARPASRPKPGGGFLDGVGVDL